MKKLAKKLSVGILSLSLLAFAGSSASAATPDDWNIATVNGIESTLENSQPYSPEPLTYVPGQIAPAAAFTWGPTQDGTVDYRYYRIMSDGSVKRLKSLVLNFNTIANGGMYAYDTRYVFTTGFPTGEYIAVYRYKNQEGQYIMEHDPRLDIVNEPQQAEGHILDGGNKVVSNFTFFSNTKSLTHAGRTGSYTITSPSGKVVQTATFRFGSNTLPSAANHTKFKSNDITSIDFGGYLNGTYKITYKYIIGAQTFTDTLNINVSGGRIASVTE